MSLFVIPAIDLSELFSAAFVLLMIVIGIFGDRKKRADAVRDRIRKEREQAAFEGAAKPRVARTADEISVDSTGSEHAPASEKPRSVEDVLAAVFGSPEDSAEPARNEAIGAPQPGWFPPATPYQYPQFIPASPKAKAPSPPVAPRPEPRSRSAFSTDRMDKSSTTLKGISAQLGDIESELGDIDVELDDITHGESDITGSGPARKRLNPIHRAIVISELLGPPVSRRGGTGRDIYFPTAPRSTK